MDGKHSWGTSGAAWTLHFSPFLIFFRGLTIVILYFGLSRLP